MRLEVQHIQTVKIADVPHIQTVELEVLQIQILDRAEVLGIQPTDFP